MPESAAPGAPSRGQPAAIRRPRPGGAAVRWVARQWWTLTRFGLSPAKLIRRIANRDEPRILCVTIPKSGTHLLERVLCLHPRLYRKIVPTLGEPRVLRRGGFAAVLDSLRAGQIAVGHLSYRPDRPRSIEERGVRCIFLVRDPRDMVVSRAFYVVADPKHPLREQFLREPDPAKRVRSAIAGDGGWPSIDKRLRDFAGWLDSGALVVRFEDLVGPAGGGDSARQEATLRRIFAHVGVPTSDTQLARIQRRAFSETSPTFRRGSTGEWRRYFDEDTKDLFREAVGDLLARYDYEFEPGW